MAEKKTVAAYVYPGWHPCPERDRHFPKGWSEWDLVYDGAPRFKGHQQPHRPLWGRYDDADPAAVGRRVRLCAAYGIDAWVYGFFWCRGKRVFQESLDRGFLGCPEGRVFPFALMWANRMPRRILPVRRTDAPVIEGDRLVPADVADFVALLTYVGERYFRMPNYLRIDDRPYFSIYDSTFFLRELGEDGAREAIALARRKLTDMGIGPVHFAAVEPASGYRSAMKRAGFDSVTHYVFLPEWKGPFQQDYAGMAARRAAQWGGIEDEAGLPYHAAVATGWDASARGADFGKEKPRKYPWWPVVTGSNPEAFEQALRRALVYGRDRSRPLDPVFVASWNEWSEGHHLEPDERYGLGWLDAVRRARKSLSPDDDDFAEAS